jgi:hypothetical protein
VATALQRAVGVVTVLVVAGVVLAPRMSNNRYDPVVVAAGLAAVGAGWTVVTLARHSAALRGRHIPRRAWDGVAAVVCVAGAGLAGFVAYHGAYGTTWDPRVVKLGSALPPEEYTDGLVRYFSRYPNMLPLLAVARTVRSWGARAGVTDYDALFGVVNTVALLVAAVALYLAVRMLRGPAWGVLGLLVLFALLGTTPWLAVPYTDMLAVWAPVTAVALFVLALRGAGRRRLVPLAAGAAVLGIGYTLKVTPVVGLVALLLTLAVAALARGADAPPRRWLGAAALVAVVAFTGTAAAAGAWVHHHQRTPPLITGRESTPLTYVASGVRVQRDNPVAVTYGGYDAVVWRRTQLRDRATQNRVAREFIRREWEARGLTGMSRFAVDKTLFNWGDGMFWAWGEGTDAGQAGLRRGSRAQAVSAWNQPGGEHFAGRVAAAQVTWLAALLAMGAGLLTARYRPDLLVAALTVAGIAAFVLVFQGRSRYLIGHVPVVVALAAAVVPGPRRREEPVPDVRDDLVIDLRDEVTSATVP